MPEQGNIFVSVAARDKENIIGPARQFASLGYHLLATSGTARVLNDANIEVERINKIQEGKPNLIDHLINGNIQMVINTPSGKGARTDEGRIRAAAVAHGVPCITTMQAIQAVANACAALREEEMDVWALQDHLADVRG